MSDASAKKPPKKKKPLTCKYCGCTDEHVIYAPTRVCIDCAFARGSDK